MVGCIFYDNCRCWRLLILISDCISQAFLILHIVIIIVKINLPENLLRNFELLDFNFLNARLYSSSWSLTWGQHFLKIPTNKQVSAGWRAWKQISDYLESLTCKKLCLKYIFMFWYINSFGSVQIPIHEPKIQPICLHLCYISNALFDGSINHKTKNCTCVFYCTFVVQILDRYQLPQLMHSWLGSSCYMSRYWVQFLINK